MATMSKDEFLNNLPKVYGLYTGGFIVFIILMAILERLGVCRLYHRNSLRDLYRSDLCGDWLHLPNDAGGCLLCRRTRGPTGLQRHGHSS